MLETPPLRESDIRPESAMAGQRAALLADVERLLSRRAEFVAVPCPACGENSVDDLFEKYGLKYGECQHCGMWFVSPRPSPAVLDWFYAGSLNYAYWNQHIFPVSEEKRRSRIFAPRVDALLDLCSRHDVSTGSLLEVGAGFGTFCVELSSRHRFSRVAGLEPTPDLAETCRRRGIEVFEAPLERVDLPPASRFDVIVAFEVIEHVFDPMAFVRKCRGLLNPGGVLLLTCPSAAGFEILSLGALSSTVDHEHLNYFTPSSMRLMLSRCGYDVIDCTTPGRLDAELVRKQILTGELNTDSQRFLRQVLIDRWDTAGDAFQDFLSANLLSSNLRVAARAVDLAQFASA